MGKYTNVSDYLLAGLAGTLFFACLTTFAVTLPATFLAGAFLAFGAGAGVGSTAFTAMP
jgi:hypothetical protein